MSYLGHIPLRWLFSWLLAQKGGEVRAKMIAYCPHCGHTDFMSYKGGDRLLCKACSKTIEPGRRGFTRLKLETARLVIASVWMADRFGSFTRSELAAHIGVTNSPHLRAQLDQLAGRGILTRSNGLHEQNHRPTWFYSRPIKPAVTSRASGTSWITPLPAASPAYMAMVATGR